MTLNQSKEIVKQRQDESSLRRGNARQANNQFEDAIVKGKLQRHMKSQKTTKHGRELNNAIEIAIIY